MYIHIQRKAQKTFFIFKFSHINNVAAPCTQNKLWHRIQRIAIAFCGGINVNHIVTKFGGTSLADARGFRRVRNILSSDENRRFAVVSAPGVQFEHDMKITDLLIQCADGNWEALQRIKARFDAIACDLGIAPISAKEFSALKNMDACEIVSRGENFCARLFARFASADFLDAACCIRLDHSGKIDLKRTANLLSGISDRHSRYIIPGFYGADAFARIQLLDRGGSDVTGAAVAVATGASVYENFTDVAGVFSADPKIVAQARPLAQLGLEQMELLGIYGAKVLHPDCCQILRGSGVKLRIRSSFDTHLPGTCIEEDTDASDICICGKDGCTYAPNGPKLAPGKAVICVVFPGEHAMRRQTRGMECIRHPYLHAAFFPARQGTLAQSIRALHEKFSS